MTDKIKQVAAMVVVVAFGVPLAAAIAATVFFPIVGFWWWLARSFFNGVFQ